MLHRKTWAVSLLLVLLAATLSGCAMGTQTAFPARDINISVDDALAGQNAGMAGVMTGSVEWTEAQFSSFLSVLLQQNTGPNFPIDSIKTWFEPDNQIFLRVTLKDGVLLGGNTIDLVGKVMVQDMHVMVDIQEAQANGYSISGPMLDMVDAQINGALGGGNMGVVLNVTTGSGTISLGMGGM